MINEINRLIIDMSKIDKNIQILKQKAGYKAKYYAVVKANGYGLGSLEISRHIEDDVDGFCVSNLEEALELRDGGISKDILILGFVQEEDIEIAAKKNITISIYDLDYAKFIGHSLEDKDLYIDAHIKLDTGHGRLGFLADDTGLERVRKLFEIKHINYNGIFSHLATADEKDQAYTIEQINKFNFIVDSLKKEGVIFDLVHLANDAGFIKHDIKYDMVRSGISLYGLYPSNLMKEEHAVDLEPVFEWKSKVSFVKEIPAGTSISYGRTFTSKGPMKVATVSVGYADGYKRCLSNKAYVLINGEKAPVIGRVTMDQMMVDVTKIENVNMRDDVTLIGKSGDLQISCDQMAEWADTITYEIITSISERVHRTYVY